MYPSPAASRSSSAFFIFFGPMASASRSKPSAASSVSRPARFPKWLAGAPWVFLHYVSDAQKFFVLQLRKGLINDGLFARTRNPNYLGEVLIYGGFALASWHWQPALVLAGWFLYSVRNMRRKDRSMSRHPEFAAYKDRTGMLLPSLGIRGAALASTHQ